MTNNTPQTCADVEMNSVNEQHSHQIKKTINLKQKNYITNSITHNNITSLTLQKKHKQFTKQPNNVKQMVN